MVSRRTTLISASVLAVLVGGGVLTYQLIAAQGQGTLSQVPLNNQAPSLGRPVVCRAWGWGWRAWGRPASSSAPVGR